MGGLKEHRTVTGTRGTWHLRVVAAEGGHGLDRHKGSAAFHIEAVQDSYPGQERLLWTTTDLSLQRVLDEVEEGLADGKIVQPAGAFYSGSSNGDGIGRPQGFVYPDVPVAAMTSLRCDLMDASKLAEELPQGSGREAAWNAYALETYGDRLLLAGHHPGFAPQDTAEMARRLFSLAQDWLERARETSVGQPRTGRNVSRARLPSWDTPTRSQEQLDGMRDALETLRIFVAYELAPRETCTNPVFGSLQARLAGVDRRLEAAALLWVPRQPPELRRGIGGALTSGLVEVFELGQALTSWPELEKDRALDRF